MTTQEETADFAVFAEAVSQLLFVHAGWQTSNKQLLTTVLPPTALQPAARTTTDINSGQLHFGTGLAENSINQSINQSVKISKAPLNDAQCAVQQ